jgi:hypothetical protein
MTRWRAGGIRLALLLGLIALLGSDQAVYGAGNCSVYKVWATNEVLTAADLNNSFTQAATTNSTPQCVDDYSATVPQMQATTNPYPNGAESQATSLAGELERLRYQIKQLVRGSSSGTYWYQPPVEPNRPNYLLNGSLEKWSSGTSTAPDRWTLSGAGATIAREAAQVTHGTYSAALTRNGTDATLTQTITDAAGGIGYVRGRTYTLGAWVRATAASRARLVLSDGAGSSFSDYHAGDATWAFLAVTRTLSASANAVSGGLQVDTGDTTAYLDAAILVEGYLAPVFTPHPAEAILTAATGARVFNSLNISIPNSAFTALTFDSERFDTSDFHSTTTNTNRLTIPTGGTGTYLLGCHVQWAGHATGDRGLALRLNGTTEVARQRAPAANAVAGKEVTVVTAYRLNASDYVECLAFQDSGGALNAQAAGNYAPEFWIYWLGP